MASDRDTLTHLWEFDHPYYCGDGNFFVAPIDSHKVHTDFDSWDNFKDTTFYSGDRDLNLLFRWDWHAWHLEYPEDYPDGQEKHELHLYFILQRKAYNVSVHVDVTPADEDEIRAWLAECALTIRALWEPITIPEEATGE